MLPDFCQQGRALGGSNEIESLSLKSKPGGALLAESAVVHFVPWRARGLAIKSNQAQERDTNP